MNLDSSAIDLAVNKKYLAFSDVVKQELRSKMSNHEISVNYSNEYDKIQKMKSAFAEINGFAKE